MANSFASALVPDTASDMAITTLSEKLASLGCFSTDFSADLVDPMRPNAIPVVTAADDAEENITDYENETNSDSTKVAKLITPAHIIKRFKITNADIQSGHKLETLFKKNLQKFSNKIMDKVLAPVTVANFGAAHVAATPADLSVDDLKTLWGESSDFSEKNIILDGTYYANFLSGNRDEYAAQDGVYGFDKFRLNNRWDGAGAGVVGGVFDSQALGVASSLPNMTDEVRDQLASYQVITLEDLGLSVLFTSWSSTATRQTWAAYEVMIGSVETDAGFAKLIATA